MGIYGESMNLISENKVDSLKNKFINLGKRMERFLNKRKRVIEESKVETVYYTSPYWDFVQKYFSDFDKVFDIDVVHYKNTKDKDFVKVYSEFVENLENKFKSKTGKEFEYNSVSVLCDEYIKKNKIGKIKFTLKEAQEYDDNMYSLFEKYMEFRDHLLNIIDNMYEVLNKDEDIRKKANEVYNSLAILLTHFDDISTIVCNRAINTKKEVK